MIAPEVELGVGVVLRLRLNQRAKGERRGAGGVSSPAGAGSPPGARQAAPDA